MWAKIIFSGKLRNYFFLQIVGIWMNFSFLKKGRHWFYPGSKIVLMKSEVNLGKHKKIKYILSVQVFKHPNRGREGEVPMRGLGTDHVISGPMRGLEKNCIWWHEQTDRRTRWLYDWIAQLGRFSEKEADTSSEMFFYICIGRSSAPSSRHFRWRPWPSQASWLSLRQQQTYSH